jgi:hypothetical protein
VEIYGVQLTEIAGRKVPTRVNSPTDNAIFEEDIAGGLSLHTHTLNNGVGVANSVVNNIKAGANPGATFTGGEGGKSGQEVSVEFTLNKPFDLAAGHYFFVPQVQLDNGDFLWLSAARPIGAFGSTPFAGDLQTWIRDDPGIRSGLGAHSEPISSDPAQPLQPTTPRSGWLGRQWFPNPRPSQW